MPHVVVIGAYGSAGVAAAETLADSDFEVTLVDDGDPGGGLCILRGCMPSKELLSVAEHAHQARHDHRIEGADALSVDLGDTVETKNDRVLGFAEHRRNAVHDLAERENVTFVHDTARIVGEHEVEIGGDTVDADYVVVATGSTLNAPAIPGIEDVDWMGSRDVLDATAFPDSGVVMGFGYVGVELVPYLTEAAGMDITVIEHDARPLDRADDRIGDELLELYREEFDVTVETGVMETAVEERDGGVRLFLDDGSHVDADQLFCFTGREPAVDGVGLENAGIDATGDWAADTMQSRDAPWVFAAGDVLGERMILHMAKEEGYLAGENVLRYHAGESMASYDPIPHYVMFAGAGVYPYASVGYTVDEAGERGYEDVVTATREASSDGIFRSKQVPWGWAKLVVAADGTVLGYHGLHHHADVMAKTMQVVVENGMDVRDLPDRAYHPTTPEILDGLFRDAKSTVG
ncbi:NAD(P)/FAD-dependent oxidoreductase [Salarchaeum sp. III]|uniref:dihydrolipoyl dehydrogenase family protein n=1 Tax=Salarchaeum sp. III TaxID=3107927 RepID=UPI002ED855F7